MLSIALRDGKINWRSGLDSPARSAPTVVDGRLFVPTLDERMVALGTTDGKRLWSYQATAAATMVLGEPAPAYSDGLLVGGFGSGDLVALRADSGTLAWSDSLAAVRGRNSLLDLSAVRGLPVIVDGVVYAIGVGGLMLALDLRSGRRIWERDIGGQYTPWIAGDWIFVLTQEQELFCLSRADGRVRWRSQLPRYENVERRATRSSGLARCWAANTSTWPARPRSCWRSIPAPAPSWANRTWPARHRWRWWRQAASCSWSPTTAP